jgi:hypothetical protein
MFTDDGHANIPEIPILPAFRATKTTAQHFSRPQNHKRDLRPDTSAFTISRRRTLAVSRA